MEKKNSNRHSSDLHFSRSFLLRSPISSQTTHTSRIIRSVRITIQGAETKTSRQPVPRFECRPWIVAGYREIVGEAVSLSRRLRSIDGQLVAAVPRCAGRLGCAKHRRLLPHRGTIRILIKKDRIAAPVTGQLISGQNVAWPGEYAEKGNLAGLSIHPG